MAVIKELDLRQIFELEDERRKGGEYLAVGTCANCGQRYRVIVPRGIPIPGNKQDCDSCGVRAVNVGPVKWD